MLVQLLLTHLEIRGLILSLKISKKHICSALLLLFIRKSVFEPVILHNCLKLESNFLGRKILKNLAEFTLANISECKMWEIS